ncbi:MAG: FtsW/RodA/SpoVE family cell cycle protein [Longimicrobiales bacterium]
MAEAAAAPWKRSDMTVRPLALLGRAWEMPALLTLTTIALSLGLVSVYSASAAKAVLEDVPDYYYLVRQAVGGAAGLVLMIAVAHTDYRRFRLMAWPILGVAAVAVAITILPGSEAIAPATNGARRWLVLGPVRIQPSEIAKLALMIWTAAMAVKKQDRLRSLTRGLGSILVVWAIVAGMIALEPSLSAAMLTLLLSGLVLFAGGARIGHFLLLAILGVPLLWNHFGALSYQIQRIVTFLDPTHDVAGVSYQVNQALIALGSGGLFGRGFGHGQQKYGFLPEPHNDFLYATIGEEWGFVGMLGVIVLFTFFALIGYRIARHAPDTFGFLVAVGVTNLIAVQAFLHMGVNLALIPATGVTLPLMSYGRSSLLVCMFALGILMNIARQTAGGPE